MPPVMRVASCALGMSGSAQEREPNVVSAVRTAAASFGRAHRRCARDFHRFGGCGNHPGARSVREESASQRRVTSRRAGPRRRLHDRAMSRKAAERRAAPDSFVEANLWVVTRGRPYKPRFRAERSVVVVSGGGAVTTDAEVAPPRSVHGARRPSRPFCPRPPVRWRRSSTPPRAPRRSSRARRARRSTSSLQPARARHAERARLPLPRPRRQTCVAAPPKLNPTDAILAADGADAALALKLLPTLGDDVLRAAVVRHPHRIHPRDFAPSSARARSPRAPRTSRAPQAAPQPQKPTSAAHSQPPSSAKTPTPTPTPFGAPSPPSSSEAFAPSRRGQRLRTPDWLMTDDAPVFYSKVTFEHDRRSKQIVQRVENVTDVVEAAISANASRATNADGTRPGNLNAGARTPQRSHLVRRTRSRLVRRTRNRLMRRTRNRLVRRTLRARRTRSRLL